MNVTNCRSCGRLFNVLSNERICPECRKKLEDKFQAVKKYLEENPHSSMETVSREMEVSVKQIKQWVREERLILSDASEAGITCECCGRMIRTGKYCDECKNTMAMRLRSAMSPQFDAEKVERAERDRESMRFLKS